MQPLRFALSSSGRVATRAFAIAIVAVYLTSFLSQVLLATPLTVRFDLWPFLAVQAVLLWIWFALHAKRLRDAGRHTGTAAGIAMLYGLAIVLLLLVMIAMGRDLNVPGGDRAVHLFAVLSMLGRIVGDPHMAGFGFILLGFLAVIMIALLVVIGFSIRTGLRPPVSAASTP